MELHINGRVPLYAGQPGGSELLFDVISTAFERTSVVRTTNLLVERCPEVLDRLTHRRHVVEASGKSYLFREARRPQSAAARKQGQQGGASTPDEQA